MFMKRTVLIVDDEILIRIGIRHSMDWEKNGYSIVGEASDGAECMQKVEMLAPDVVLLDINMPRMDGIQVLKALKERHYKGRIVILTSYSDLEYARQALKYGAADYVLKTSINENGLYHAMKELSFEDDDEGQEQKNPSRPDEQTIRMILDGYEMDADELNVKPFNLYCIVIKILDLKNIMSRYKNKKSDFFYESFQSLMMQNFSAMEEYLAAQYKADQYVAYLSFSRVSSMQECYIRIRQVAQHLSKVLKEYLMIDTYIGVSRPQYNLDNMKDAYEEAVSAIGQSFRSSGSGIFFLEGTPQEKEENEEQLRKMEKNMYEELAKQNYEQLSADIRTYLEFIKNHKNMEIRECITFLIELARMDELFAGKGNGQAEEIRQAENLSELEEIVIRIVDSFAEKEEIPASNHFIRKAEKYLKENYSHPISLKDLSEYLGLSESYTSRLFNRVKGVTIPAYINDLRIDKARELLAHTDDKIYKIASETGYTSTTAFHIAFRKKEGITPIEYRNKYMIIKK